MNKILRLKRRIFLIYANVLGKLLEKLFRKFAQIKISLNATNYDYLRQTKNSKLINSKWTFVIQGPILNSSHLEYLRNNLKIISENFSGVKIIISTYAQYQSQMDLIPRNYYDKLVISNEEKYTNNFERQVVSTHLGLMAAKSYKREFVLKMRTDQMIYYPGALNVFDVMLKTYKDATGMGNSLIASSYNSWLYRPFGVSDMLMAGFLHDMQNYWNYDDQIRSMKLELNKNSPLINVSGFFNESFLAVKYLIYKNFEFTGNLFSDTTQMYKKHIIIVDSTSINHNWFKRNPVWNGNSIIKSGYTLPANALIEISHSDWLCLKFDTHAIQEDRLAARH